MLDGLVDPLVNHLLTYGLIIVALVCFLEGALIGKFFPTEFLVPIAVIMHGGTPEVGLAVLVLATLSSTAGQYALFSIITDEGREYVISSPRIRLNRTHLNRTELYFNEYGLAAVAFVNMFPVIRSLLTIPAALSHAPAGRFVLASALGNTVYHSAFIVAALVFDVFVL